MSRLERDSQIGSLIKSCSALVKLKVSLDSVEEQEGAFRDEFSDGYSKLLVSLEAALENTDDPTEEKRLKKEFVAAAVLLMGVALRKRGTSAMKAGWRDDAKLTDRDAFLLKLEGEWTEAIGTGFSPHLEKAAEYKEGSNPVDRFGAVGSYGMMFAGMVWAAYWGAQVGSGTKDTFYEWGGFGDKRTCFVCDDRIGRKYRASMLPGIPGDRSTPCNGNCRCWLIELTAYESLGVQETMKRFRRNIGNENKTVDGEQPTTACGELDRRGKEKLCGCGKRCP